MNCNTSMKTEILNIKMHLIKITNEKDKKNVAKSYQKE